MKNTEKKQIGVFSALTVFLLIVAVLTLALTVGAQKKDAHNDEIPTSEEANTQIEGGFTADQSLYQGETLHETSYGEEKDKTDGQSGTTNIKETETNSTETPDILPDEPSFPTVTPTETAIPAVTPDPVSGGLGSNSPDRLNTPAVEPTPVPAVKTEPPETFTPAVTPVPSETPAPPLTETPTPTPQPPLVPTESSVPVEPSGAYEPEDGVSDSAFLVTVYDAESKKILTMSLDEYVKLALAAEMSASAPMEALKAQAVAIRSYVLAKAGAEYEEHHGAMTCNDMMHCMTSLSRDEYDALYSSERSAYEQAVRETDGMVVCYNGSVATTNFHSCSYFYTASSLEVFGKDLPYLQAVPTGVYQEVFHIYTMSTRELLTGLFGDEGGKVAQSGEPVFGRVTESASGRIESVTIFGKEVSGKRFRTVFGFPSTTFEVSYNPKTDAFTFSVYGSGHGAGMSQSGAKLMAAEGADYVTILTHYYSHTTVEKMTNDLLEGLFT